MSRYSALTRASALLLAACVVAAVIAPLITPSGHAGDVVRMRFLSPGSRDAWGTFHLLGTDRLGRDVWSRLVYGARVSLTVGVVTVVIAVLIGALVGAAAALGPRLLTTMLLGITDFALAVPRVVLLLLLAALWQPGTVQVVVVLAATGWMTIARLVYSEVRAQLGRPYVDGAFALGATRGELAWRHILPHAAAPVLAAAVLGIGNAITLEAGLSFLGLGVQPPTPSWGSLIASGRDTVVNAPWVGLAPGIALVVVVVACALVSDGVQERWSTT